MDADPASVADSVDHKLDPRIIQLARLRNGITAAVLALMAFVGMLMFWVATERWAAGLLLVPLWMALSGGVAWLLRRWPAIAYRYASYRVEEGGIEIRRGVYWRSITNVPRSRVQHTDVSQGPLERRFELGTLVIHTAGTAHSRVTLEGLEHGTAQRIRAHLLPGTEGDAV